MKNKHSLGQNWLKDRTILDLIAEIAATPSNNSSNKKVANICVEIGPGLGTLTSSLLKRFDKVIAVEFDQSLAHNLPKSFPGKNLQVVNEDILQFDFSKITEPFVAAGNIPYYITTPIIMKLLESEYNIKSITVMVQKEVGERLCSGRK